MVNQSMWMDTVSKRKTIDKVGLMTIFEFSKTYILTQAQAVLGKIGYPDYLDSDNLTKLESIYAEVRYRHALYPTNYIVVIEV